jgi:hypothetical protein
MRYRDHSFYQQIGNKTNRYNEMVDDHPGLARVKTAAINSFKGWFFMVVPNLQKVGQSENRDLYRLLTLIKYHKTHFLLNF